MKKTLSVLFSVVIALGLFSSTVFAFTDVDETMHFYPSIEFMEDQGAVVGYSDGSYGYDKPVNRAEMLKIVIEARQILEGRIPQLDDFQWDSCFDDVAGSQWYTKYVCYAKDAGWIVGYDDDTFRPDQDISFVEAMKIVLEVFGTDYDETTLWYQGIVETAADENIIPITIRAFYQVVNRAEMADMVVRKVKAGEGYLDEFLGDRLADVNVTFDDIKNGVDNSEILIGCGGPDCDNVCVYNGITYNSEDYVTKNECNTCQCFEGDYRYCTGLCPEDDDSGDDDDLASDATEEELITDLCSMGYDGVDEIYTGFTCDETEYDFSENATFQSSFPDFHYYVSGTSDASGLLVGDKLYYNVLYNGSSSGITSTIHDYNTDTEEFWVRHEEVNDEEKGLEIIGADLSEDVLVMFFDEYSLDERPDCYFPDYAWFSEDLYSFPLDGDADELSPYYPPTWKVEEAEEAYNACME